MSSAQQVANSFVTEFFERLAKNPADLAELYGHHASLHINDFETGIAEAFDSDVPAAAQKWAACVADSELRVESVNAAPVLGGVNVFVTLSALGAMQQYFQITTTLEAYHIYNAEGYFVRAQVISRIGAIENAGPAEPTQAPPAAPVEEAPAPIKEETPKKKVAKKAATPAAEEPAAPVVEAAPVEAPEPAAAAEQPAAPAPKKEEAPAKPAAPKSWASLAGSAPSKSAAAIHPIRVIAHEGPAAKKEETPAKDGKAAAQREAHPKREKRVERPVGERLMFNVTATVTDDEIKAALAELAANLVSLRNASDRGHVFMDFAEGVAAYETLRHVSPAIGTAGQKMSVYFQRPRETRQ